MLLQLKGPEQWWSIPQQCKGSSYNMHGSDPGIVVDHNIIHIIIYTRQDNGPIFPDQRYEWSQLIDEQLHYTICHFQYYT